MLLFVAGLHHHEPAAARWVELHLERLPAATPEERLQADVGLEVRREPAAPRHRGVRRREHSRQAGRYRERHGRALRHKRHEPGALQLHVEQPAGDNGRHLLHHGDDVGHRSLERQQLVARHHQGLPGLEPQHGDALGIVRQEQAGCAVGGGDGELGVFACEVPF